MTVSELKEAISNYNNEIEAFENNLNKSLPITEAKVLNILMARDRIQKVLTTTTFISDETLTTLQELDNILKQNKEVKAAIAPLLSKLRSHFNPDTTAWWWHLEAPKTDLLAKVKDIQGEDAQKQWEKCNAKANPIYPDPGIRVRIICPDRTNKPVTAGVPSGIKTICPIWEVRIAKAPQAPGVLGGIDASIPYLISPRHSLTLSNTPTFRWNAVADATEYTVELRSSNNVIWKTQVKDTQIVYSGNPPLESGIFYSLNIQANTGWCL